MRHLPVILLLVAPFGTSADTSPPTNPTTFLNTTYPFTKTYTTFITSHWPPPQPFGLPPDTFTTVAQEITTLEPHSFSPTTYPLTIVQTAITTLTNTVFTFPFPILWWNSSTTPPIESRTFTVTTTRHDTYHVHTPAPSHLPPGWSFSDFPKCGECVIQAVWMPEPECEALQQGTGCSNQQCLFRSDEGEKGLWYCFAGSDSVGYSRDYMGRGCWYGDYFEFRALGKPCVYGDQLPHCVPCVGEHIPCEGPDGACEVRPGHTEVGKAKETGI